MLNVEYCCERCECKEFNKKYCWQNKDNGTIGTECYRDTKLYAEEIGLVFIPKLGWIYDLEEMNEIIGN